jgi:hypothetical protein
MPELAMYLNRLSLTDDTSINAFSAEVLKRTLKEGGEKEVFDSVMT